MKRISAYWMVAVVAGVLATGIAIGGAGDLGNPTGGASQRLGFRRRVHVLGSFNGFDPAATALSVRVSVGRYADLR
ncbi:MAG: hypothetical protein U0176_02535 [Bacteroidia bacterium]